VTARETWRTRILALILFLWLPLQFRYGMEARAYSQGLLFSLISFGAFQVLLRRPSLGWSVVYGASVVAGIYSLPYTCFPIAAQAAWVCRPRCSWRSRAAVLIPAAIGAIAYWPWHILQQRALASHAEWRYQFAFDQVRPAALLHDLSGGGYVCSIALLVLCAVGMTRSRSLLAWIAGVSLAGPILADWAFSYFFATRQILFAWPALVALAARGAPRNRVTWALAGAFVVSAAVSDFRAATVPRDEMAASADALAQRLGAGDCFLTTPASMTEHFTFLHPELRNRVCPGNPTAPQVYVAITRYTRPADRDLLEHRLGGRYRSVMVEKIGQAEIAAWRSRS